MTSKFQDDEVKPKNRINTLNVETTKGCGFSVYCKIGYVTCMTCRFV